MFHVVRVLDFGRWSHDLWVLLTFLNWLMQLHRFHAKFSIDSSHLSVSNRLMVTKINEVS